MSMFPMAMIYTKAICEIGSIQIPVNRTHRKIALKRINTKANKTSFFIFNQNTILHVSRI